MPAEESYTFDGRTLDTDRPSLAFGRLKSEIASTAGFKDSGLSKRCTAQCFPREFNSSAVLLRSVQQAIKTHRELNEDPIRPLKLPNLNERDARLPLHVKDGSIRWQQIMHGGVLHPLCIWSCRQVAYNLQFTKGYPFHFSSINDYL